MSKKRKGTAVNTCARELNTLAGLEKNKQPRWRSFSHVYGLLARKPFMLTAVIFRVARLLLVIHCRPPPRSSRSPSAAPAMSPPATPRCLSFSVHSFPKSSRSRRRIRLPSTQRRTPQPLQVQPPPDPAEFSFLVGAATKKAFYTKKSPPRSSQLRCSSSTSPFL